ncbi:MAG: hypothetical protein V1484_00595 [bacterium]
MNIDHYSYIYSAMTQSTGALLALVGVFIIFRIKLQEECIDSCAERIRKITFDPRSIDAYRILIDHEDTSQKEKDKILNAEVEQNMELFKKHEKILEDTIKRGKDIVKELAFIFLFYVLILHLNEFIYFYQLNYLKNTILTLSFIFTACIVVKLVKLLLNCLQYDLKKVRLEKPITGQST